MIQHMPYGVQGKPDTENVETLKVILEDAEKWREVHGARFESSKYILVRFIKRKCKTTVEQYLVSSLTI